MKLLVPTQQKQTQRHVILLHRYVDLSLSQSFVNLCMQLRVVMVISGVFVVAILTAGFRTDLLFFNAHNDPQ